MSSVIFVSNGWMLAYLALKSGKNLSMVTKIINKILLYAKNGFSMVRWHLMICCLRVNPAWFVGVSLHRRIIRMKSSTVDIATYNEIMACAHSTAHTFCYLTQSWTFLASWFFWFFKCTFHIACIHPIYSFVLGCISLVCCTM